MRRPTRTLGKDPSRTACWTSQRLMPSRSAVCATLNVGRLHVREAYSGTGVGIATAQQIVQQSDEPI